ncbi:hypothetical protein [Hymenobacter crusticola]|uniref:Phytase-like domain-containing protein n=1 Tax=Hymenobacter crusticola TaxID=1770526 RepID=A0A243WDU4_9BACT|nr:hypothetical protein [Hymenobacter crusticola]OUJ73263.1 hypothetical protein BXP70_15710 [Hymenobacter crusticola]
MKMLLLLASGLTGAFFYATIHLTLTASTTVNALGACQGASYQRGQVYLYGDREVGVIRTYTAGLDSLTYAGQEVKLTEKGQDVINHPTGIAWNGQGPTFIGNSIRLNPEGTKWRAVIYCVDWAGLLRTGTLDGNLLNTIEDDACIQGTRPEYVQYQGKQYVATADYGDHGNEVRLYDPARLAKARKTSEPGVLVKKFACSPWVQNLHWVPAQGVLVLIQNQVEGRRWRFTFVDLAKSLATGHEVVRKVVDVDKTDELEGFTLLGDAATGLAVTSSPRDNAHFMRLAW